MKAMLKLFDTWWLQTLGYTLLHSLWQALIVAAVVILIVRFIPNKLSATRYMVASFALLTIALLSIATFVYLSTTSPARIKTTAVFTTSYTPKLLPEVSTSVSTYLANAGVLIRYLLPLFLMVWIFGTSLFSVRILAGLIYVEKLRRKSTLLQNEWTHYIQQLTKQLSINRFVSLAESSLVQVPVVIGHLKPIILIPIGMCTSLSIEQLETIFLHEMTHIRRKDYLINLLQVAAEAVYFFNPFVWIISGIMKREREHCCDDAVVQLHGSVIEYAHALAALEELRLSRTGFALSLAGNKNQLLNRIKRLMETSVKNYSSRERIAPALLLVIGLICASWMSTHTAKTELSPSSPDRLIVVSDTVKKNKKIKNNKKTESKSKETSAIRKEQNSKSDLEPDLSDAKEFELDYALQFNQGHFPIVDNDFGLPMVPPFPQILLTLDSPGLGFRENDWEEFSNEFKKNFESNFGDFYEKHQQDIQRMLEEVHDKVNGKFDKEWELKMEELALKQVELASTFEKRQHEALSSHQQSLKGLKEVESLEKTRSLQHESFEKSHREFEKSMEAFNERKRTFEEKMKEQLIKDGYLGKDEKLETMHWHNGKIEINGKKIKPEDEKKYNEIHDEWVRCR